MKKKIKSEKIGETSGEYPIPIYVNHTDYWQRLFEFRTKLNCKMWEMFWEYDIELDDLVQALESWTKDIKDEVKKQSKWNS